jgi:ABC-type uncharacterized transport system substrate-binding protein
MMKSVGRHVTSIACRMAQLLCLLLSCSSIVHAADLPRIFIVHSYDPENFVSLPQDNGLIEGLTENGFVDNETVVIKRFFMDTKRTYTRPEQIEARGKEALAEIKAFKPDLVITVDDNAARTVMLPLVDSGIPIVFTGINSLPEAYNQHRRFMQTRIHPAHNVTGVYEKLYVWKSVQLMREVLNNLKKIVLIVDDSPTGNAIRKQMENELAANGSDILYSIRQVGTFADYKQLIRLIDSNPEIGAYYPVAVRLSTDDGTVVTGRDILAWTLGHARKPAFAVNNFTCKLGVFGGVSVDFTAMGRQAARKAVLILKGTKAGDISIEDAAEYALIFNIARARQLGVTIAPELLGAADHIYETMLLPGAAKLFHILIVQSNEKGLGAGADVEKGMLAELAGNGFVEAENLQISRFYMQTRRKYTTPDKIHQRGQAALSAVEKMNPDLVITLDDTAVQEVMLPLVDSSFPVLFGSMILPPEWYNLKNRFMVSRANPGHNVSGVTGEFEYEKSMETIQIIFPEAKNMVLINSGNAAWLDKMNMLLKKQIAACSSKCSLTSIRLESVVTVKEFKRLILKNNDDPDVDIVSAVFPVGLTREDGTVSPLPEILAWLFQHQKKPGFTFCDSWVKYGYLLAAAINFEATGRQLGDQVLRVIHGSDPGDMAIQSPVDSYLAVNMARAEQLGLALSVDILEAARKIYYKMEPEKAH